MISHHVGEYENIIVSVRLIMDEYIVLLTTWRHFGVFLRTFFFKGISQIIEFRFLSNIIS